MTTTLTDISAVLDEDCGLLPNLFESGDELLVDCNVLVGTLNHDDLTGS